MVDGFRVWGRRRETTMVTRGEAVSQHNFHADTRRIVSSGFLSSPFIAMALFALSLPHLGLTLVFPWSHLDLVGEADLPSRQLVLQSFESPIVLCTTFRFAAYDDERPATASPLASQLPHNNHGDDAIRIPHQFQVEREISCDAKSAQQSTVMLLLQQLKEGNTQDDPAECSRVQEGEGNQTCIRILFRLTKYVIMIL